MTLFWYNWNEYYAVSYVFPNVQSYGMERQVYRRSRHLRDTKPMIERRSEGFDATAMPVYQSKIYSK